MNKALTKLKTNPAFSNTYNKVLASLPYIGKGFVTSILIEDYINRFSLNSKILGFLSNEEQEVRLARLPKIKRLRTRLHAGLDLTPEEVEILLLRTRGKFESEILVTNFNASIETAQLLKFSKRKQCQNAYILLLSRNLDCAPAWAYQSLGLNNEKFDKTVTNLLVTKPEFKDFFFAKFQENKEFIDLRLRFIAYFNKEQLVNEIEYALSPEFELVAKSGDYSLASVIKYLSMVLYYLEKNDIKTSCIRERLANIIPIKNSETPEDLTLYSFDKNTTLEKILTRVLSIYTPYLDEKDYLYILENSGLTTDLAFRTDIDMEYIERYANSTIEISAEYRCDHASLRFWEIHNILTDMFSLSNKALRDNIYKLIPYLILYESPQALASRGRTFEGHYLTNALSYSQVAEINSLYSGLTPERYPLIEPTILKKIKKRLTYAYAKFFIFNGDCFEENPSLNKNCYYGQSLGKHQKIALPRLRWAHVIYDIDISALKKIRTRVELEKFIIIHECAKTIPDRVWKLRLRGKAEKDYNYADYKKYISTGDYLRELSKKITVDQLETAVAMLPEWGGTVEDFEKMVVLL